MITLGSFQISLITNNENAQLIFIKNVQSAMFM